MFRWVARICVTWIFVLSLVQPCRAFEEDKLLHAVVSFGIATVAYNHYHKEMGWSQNKARVGAFVTAMAAGLAKEWIDEEFDGKDMAANAGGALLGVIVAFKF